jgi:hypothetical protein
MSNARKFIVTTTINPTTAAIEQFDARPEWTLIVVGDRRTPPDYRLENGIYLSPEDQERLAPELSDLIGWNCIQRRNLGFVMALDLDADLIATVDDDNLPYPSWGRDTLVGRTVELKTYTAANGCFDPLGATEHGHLWHRGYPLQLLTTRDYSRCEVRSVHVDVQADLWDGDPDVDAVCRLEHAPNVRFDPAVFPCSSNAISYASTRRCFPAPPMRFRPSIRRTHSSDAMPCRGISWSPASVGWTTFGVLFISSRWVTRWPTGRHPSARIETRRI